MGEREVYRGIVLQPCLSSQPWASHVIPYNTLNLVITVLIIFDLGFVLSLCNTHSYRLITCCCCSLARYELVKGRTCVDFVFVSLRSNIVLDIGQVHNKCLLLVE